MDNVSEKSEVISRNFIESIIDKDLEEGSKNPFDNTFDNIKELCEKAGTTLCEWS